LVRSSRRTSIIVTKRVLQGSRGALAPRAAGASAPAPDRAGLLARVRAAGTWDIVVIGGGATGLGCAVDAAARGHTVLVLEAHDFGKGTSSRATKLIHGGVRYLAQGDIALVREALHERSRLLANAPHLVRPLRFVVPVYRRRDALLYGAGLGIYDLLAGSHRIGRRRRLDPVETIAALPTVRADGLRGGIAYWDAQFDDARLAIALMRTVIDLGGVALNYAGVDALAIDNGRVVGVRARDAESGERFSVAARVVINATGVWADRLRGLEGRDVRPLLRPSQGVHVVVDRDFLPGTDAMLVPRTADGRVLFVIPWQGKVLIGTTDTPRDDVVIEPAPLAGELDFILGAAGAYLVRPPTRADLRSVFVGLRPLLGGAGRTSTSALSREHLVEVSPGGLVTVTGGKWTTYRRMAEEAVDAAEQVAGLPHRACTTATLALHGATTQAGADGYGSERALIDTLPGSGHVIHPGLALTEAEVRHAARHELARTVEDVLARRHRVLFFDAALAAAVAPTVARLLADELGGDAAWCEAETARFRALAAQYAGRGA
jgi:glycerol-3-phosphate dehydrogenase